MNPTPRMKSIRANAGYVAASVHYNRRKFDKQYEVVARLYDAHVDELGLNIGGEVVLDVRADREAALEAVRFFRGQETAR